MTVIQLKKRPDMKRTAVYMPLSVHNDIERIAVENGISTNSAMVQLLEQAIQAEAVKDFPQAED